jgi:hypothetical protein
MNDSTPKEIGLTSELLEYVCGVALKEARKRSPKFVDQDDVAQGAVLHLMSCPPKFNPAKGASQRTLIYIAVQRFVLKYIARQCRHADRFRQVETTSADGETADPGAESNSIRPRTTDVTAAEIADVTEPGQSAVERVRRELRCWHSMTDNVLDFIVDESSRDLCRLVVECDGNVSAAARQLGVAEGTIRRAFWPGGCTKRQAPRSRTIDPPGWRTGYCRRGCGNGRVELADD